MDELRQWAAVGISMGSLLTVWFLAVRGASRSQTLKLEGQIVKLESETGGLDRRLSLAESRMEHMPDSDTSHRLEMAIARLEGRLETLDERMKPVAAMANRVHERMFEEAHR